jgi:hypothetical protein
VSIKIGPPESLPVQRVCVVKIPNYILSIAKSTPCRIVPGPNSTLLLISSTGDRLGEFKADFDGQPATAELLRRPTPEMCAPVLNEVHELTFKATAARADVPVPHPKKKVVSIRTTPTNIPVWAPSRSFRSIQAVRDRFDDSCRELSGLLAEIRAAVQNPSNFHPAMMRKAYNDVMALVREQDACTNALLEITNRLNDKQRTK